jgi:anti-anti-sigma factor
VGPFESSSVIVRGQNVLALFGTASAGTVVMLRGEHDRSTVSALSETLTQAIAMDDTELVVDLSGVEFMDGGTVYALVTARDWLRERSRSLRLVFPSPRARRVLDLCGVEYVAHPAVDANGAQTAEAIAATCDGS